MSVDATQATWKLGKEVTAVQKLLLLSLADRAGENGECWPGLLRLMKDTNLDRHTIVENRKILIEKKFIEYTGRYEGRTKSVPVMRLTYIKNREGKWDESQEFLSSVEMPTASKISSVNMPTTKQCGFPHLEPKRIEPKIKEKEINKEKEKKSFSYPETLYPVPKESIIQLSVAEIVSENKFNIPAQMIGDWVHARKTRKKPVTKTVWKRLNSELQKIKEQGRDPIDAFEMMVAQGWDSLNANWISQQNRNYKTIDHHDQSWRTPEGADLL